MTLIEPYAKIAFKASIQKNVLYNNMGNILKIIIMNNTGIVMLFHEMMMRSIYSLRDFFIQNEVSHEDQ